MESVLIRKIAYVIAGIGLSLLWMASFMEIIKILFLN
jgi:hypothetical protein